jgi:eukaryotic-like serine/threonine-protein kinase
MKNDRWQLVEHLYHAALEQDSGARAAFLVSVCNGDDSLHREVTALLAYDKQAHSFIETPALELEVKALSAEATGEKTDQKSTWLAVPGRIGQYELLRPLGKGGMGEVHLALDTRLKRKVAIKLLPAELTEETDWGRRFEQEAQAASALNHPNTLTIYEIGEIENRRYIVTEFIEGETLRQRMESAPQKRLRPTEAVKIAAQVASALEAAHEAGIIHRDIKPENIMVRKDGLIKVLDFGLAKISRIQVETESFKSEKLSTRSGIVMGTVTYMSPEQARGQKVDYRTDMFSLGVTLYEMLSGQKPFDGLSVSDVIVAVLTQDAASLRAVVPEVPMALETIVNHCLEKQPEKRFQSASDLRFALEALSLSPSTPSKTAMLTLSGAEVKAVVAKQLPLLKQNWFGWILAAAVGIFFIVASVLAVIHLREQPEEKLAASFTFSLPENWNFRWFDAPTVSPDGKFIVFSALPSGAQDGGNSALWIRRLDSAEAKILPGTEGGILPFWSPDSRFIAFWANGKLQKIELGGAAVTICEAQAWLPGTWNQDGVILFAMDSRLRRVNAAGGQAVKFEPLVEGETNQENPRFLPDGKRFLYFSKNKDSQQDGIYVATLDSNKGRKRVLEGAMIATYVAPGYLLFAKGDVLMAQPFDLGRCEVTGEAVRVAEQTANYEPPSSPPFVAFSASENGVLAWKVKTDEMAGTQLTWLDRSGKKLTTVGETASYSGPALSPDEKRLVVAQVDPRTSTRDLWIFDLLGGGSTRLTFDPADDINPVWSPDGKWIIFTSVQNGNRSIYRKLADGSNEMEAVFEGAGDENVEDVSPNGRFILFNSRVTGEQPPDLSLVSLTGERKPSTFFATPARDDQAQFSPDGRWVTYHSEDGKGAEIYVRSFAADRSRSGGKWQISNNGGCQPRWRGDGQEIFYLNRKVLMAVDVKGTGATFTAGTPKQLFSVNIESEERRNRFVVTKDGQRFLFITVTEAIGGSTMAVRLNWLADLPR